MQDDEILSLFEARDEKALAEIRAQYGALIKSVSYGILRSREDAEECENEVYLRAWNSIPPARPARLSAFLCRIARNVSLDRYDYNHASKRGETLPLEELETALKGTAAADDRLSENELSRLMSEFLKKQDYNSRVIFMRRFWFSDSIAEISRRMHISQGAVKTRISRTLKKLREYLVQQGYTL